MRPENPSDGKNFRPQLGLYDPCTHTNVSCTKILAHYAENEHFPLLIPRSLLYTALCDIVVGHGCGIGLDPRSNITLPGVVQSINVHHLPHPHQISVSDHNITRCPIKKRSWNRRWKMLFFSVMRGDFRGGDICAGARIIEP